MPPKAKKPAKQSKPAKPKKQTAGSRKKGGSAAAMPPATGISRADPFISSTVELPTPNDAYNHTNPGFHSSIANQAYPLTGPVNTGVVYPHELNNGSHALFGGSRPRKPRTQTGKRKNSKK